MPRLFQMMALAVLIFSEGFGLDLCGKFLITNRGVSGFLKLGGGQLPPLSPFTYAPDKSKAINTIAKL